MADDNNLEKIMGTLMEIGGIAQGIGFPAYAGLLDNYYKLPFLPLDAALAAVFGWSSYVLYRAGQVLKQADEQSIDKLYKSTFSPIGPAVAVGIYAAVHLMGSIFR